MKIPGRALAAFGHDLIMAALSFYLSLYLRVGGEGIADYETTLMLYYGAVFTALSAVVFATTGLYRGLWRFVSLPDLLAVLRAATLIILIYFPLM
ncbi:MAG TPA: polysaccharide biosynthesis protein, partial [Stellaceae bacterium]|nr:polysaccharide biosynthesis protein [Stellaceae bacterium]